MSSYEFDINSVDFDSLSRFENYPYTDRIMRLNANGCKDDNYAFSDAKLSIPEDMAAVIRREDDAFERKREHISFLLFSDEGMVISPPPERETGLITNYVVNSNCNCGKISLCHCSTGYVENVDDEMEINLK